MAMIMTNQQHPEAFDKSMRDYEIKREDAMDCFHSIIDLVKKHFAKNDSYFVVWLNVCFEFLKKKFDYAELLKKIIIVQDYIDPEKDYDAFNNINNLINTIYDLEL